MSDEGLAERLAQNAYHESRRYRCEAVREQWLEAYRVTCRAEEGASPQEIAETRRESATAGQK